MVLENCIIILSFLLLILVTYKMNKTFSYFVSIIFIFIILNRYIELNKTKENFNVNTASDALRESVKTTKDIDLLREQVSNMDKNVNDLTDVMKRQTINKAMESGSEAKNFSLTDSQKRQDLELDNENNLHHQI